MNRSIVAAAAALAFAVVLVPTAHAGTKYLSTIVPLSTGSPTLSGKSRVLFKEQGTIKAKLKDVRAGGGAGSPVTTDQSYKNGTLSGDEYVVVIGGSLPSIGIDFEINLIVEPKSGNGTVKIDGSALFDLIPGGLVRSVVINTTEVHGPLGGPASIAACQANLDTSDGISFPPATNPCMGGTLIGAAGILAP